MDAYSERVITGDFHNRCWPIYIEDTTTAVELGRADDDQQSIASARDVDFDNILQSYPDVTKDEVSFDFEPELRAVLSSIHSADASSSQLAFQDAPRRVAPVRTVAETVAVDSSSSSGPAGYRLAVTHSQVQLAQTRKPSVVRAVSIVRPPSSAATPSSAQRVPVAPDAQAEAVGPVPHTLDEGNSVPKGKAAAPSFDVFLHQDKSVVPHSEPALVPSRVSQGEAEGKSALQAAKDREAHSKQVRSSETEATPHNHTQAQLDVRPRQTPLAIPCALWAQGRRSCVFGDACAFAHVEGVQRQRAGPLEAARLARLSGTLLNGSRSEDQLSTGGAPAPLVVPRLQGKQQAKLVQHAGDEANGSAMVKVDQLRADVNEALSGLANEKSRFLAVVLELEDALRTAQEARAAAEEASRKERETTATAADAARQASEAASSALQALATSRAEAVDLHHKLELVRGDQVRARKEHAALAQRLKTVDAARAKAVAAVERARSEADAYKERLQGALADLQTVQRSSSLAVQQAREGAQRAARDMAVLRDESSRLQQALLSKDQALEEAARVEGGLRAALAQQQEYSVTLQQQAGVQMEQVRNEALTAVEKARADRDDARRAEEALKAELAHVSAELSLAQRTLQQSLGQSEAWRQEASEARAHAAESAAAAALAQAQMLRAREEAQAATDAMVRLRTEVLSLQAGMSADVLSLQAVTAQARTQAEGLRHALPATVASSSSFGGKGRRETVQRVASISPVRPIVPSPGRAHAAQSPARSADTAPEANLNSSINTTQLTLAAFVTPNGSTGPDHTRASARLEHSGVDVVQQREDGGGVWPRVTLFETAQPEGTMAPAETLPSAQAGPHSPAQPGHASNIVIHSQVAVPLAAPASFSSTSSKPSKGRKVAAPSHGGEPGPAPILDAEGVAEEEQPRARGLAQHGSMKPVQAASSPRREGGPAQDEAGDECGPSPTPVPTSHSPMTRPVLLSSPPARPVGAPHPPSMDVAHGSSTGILGSTGGHMEGALSSPTAQEGATAAEAKPVGTPLRAPAPVAHSALFVSPPSPSRAFRPVPRPQERQEWMAEQEPREAGDEDYAREVLPSASPQGDDVMTAEQGAGRLVPSSTAHCMAANTSTPPQAMRAGSPDIPRSTDSEQQRVVDGLDLSVVLEATGAELIDMLNNGVQGLWSTLVRADSRGTPDSQQ